MNDIVTLGLGEIEEENYQAGKTKRTKKILKKRKLDDLSDENKELLKKMKVDIDKFSL